MALVGEEKWIRNTDGNHHCARSSSWREVPFALKVRCTVCRYILTDITLHPGISAGSSILRETVSGLHPQNVLGFPLKIESNAPLSFFPFLKLSLSLSLSLSHVESMMSTMSIFQTVCQCGGLLTASRCETQFSFSIQLLTKTPARWYKVAHARRRRCLARPCSGTKIVNVTSDTGGYSVTRLPHHPSRRQSDQEKAA